ncbi:conserved hypothetical protein [Pediculus humanus corporis]|uniref:Protein unc-13 homolog 4B n=1 Tax=Pediculus humanus subsp. corporis TaxID=121224 RepID=E0VIH4_PEDHC|nr:uncharacterized protein Phum_PHUM227580 [Pediculus humanus corporis]EEB13180.1 conserved hypothetical protein [Pediculus humanus corporis]
MMSINKPMNNYFRGVKKEEIQRQTNLLIQTMTIEELYSEILFEILNNVGCDVESTEEQTEIINYLQQAFHLEDDKHSFLLQTAKEKEPPNILLNVEVIEAKDLKPKDCNGLSDPFCTLYLNSTPTHRYNTSVKTETLCPVWEEHFSLPVHSPADDVLHVEVWDFDPAETIREKMTKIGDVKGVKGFSKLIKEIAVTASTGKHDNELVGTTNIPLKVIPASGQTFWLHLKKKSKTKKRGDVKLKLSFSSEKNSQVSLQEYRHLLKLLLLHELNNTKVDPYEWNGNFSSLAKDILTQHIAQSGLTTSSVLLAQWIEFISVHSDHPLNFILFKNILLKLTTTIHAGNLQDDELKLFWEATKKFLPSCINYIRKIRKYPVNNKTITNQANTAISILSILSDLNVPEDVTLFSRSTYGWLREPEENEDGKYEIKQVVKEAIIQGASDWYNHLISSNSEEKSLEDQLQLIIRVVQFVRTDIQRALESYEKVFKENMQFSYARILYEFYEEKISEMAEDVVVEACKLLKPIKFKEIHNRLENRFEEGDDNPMLKMGTTLFELYLGLQRFAILGTGLCPTGSSFKINEFHLWFHRGVAQWLDIALYKAMQRIEKAAELDNLKPVDSSVKYSSSAVDTLAIFYQIKIFWKQLAWPDVEGSYTFIAKIIDDICRCCIFYADRMTRKVEGIGHTSSIYEDKFQVTHEWCLAINNIDYVRTSIPTFSKDLGLDDIISALADFQSPSAADHCKQTLTIIVENAMETVGNKILELQDTVVSKMSPSINRFLMEGAELLHRESNSVERLMQYLDENLIMLNNQLNEDNFQGILNVIWNTVALLLNQLVKNSLEKRRPPSFFSNLYLTLQILKNFFKKTEDSKSNTKLASIEHNLRLHGLETWELIHQFHLERFKEQEEMENANLGYVTVRGQFVDNLLKIEIMNARNLHPKDSNGSCDPYVKINLIPEEKFSSVTKPRTKTHKKTTFPLFDEVFSMQLTSDQKNIENSLIHFIIKDQDFLGNEFLGEAYMDLKNIPTTDSSVSIHSLSQIHLKLSRPTNFNSEAFKALEHRIGDKLAREFLKKQRTKISP